MRVLVAYGSKRGGTQGIAQIVGDVLTAAGHQVDVVPAAGLRGLDGWDAVIVGGALYAMRWHADARRFVRRHAGELRVRPVWLFSSGPLDDSAQRRELPPIPSVQRLMQAIGARGHVTFGGRLAPDARGFVASRMARQHAGDWRDPARIAAWARDVAETLAAAPAVAPGPVHEAPVAVYRALEALTLFTGATAVGGGVALLANPQGGRGLPPAGEVLRHAPFASFLWPGLLLLLVIGGSNLVAALRLLRRDPDAEVAAGFAGFALVVWTLTEMLLLRTVVWLQLGYLAIGAATVLLAAWAASRRPGRRGVAHRGRDLHAAA